MGVGEVKLLADEAIGELVPERVLAGIAKPLSSSFRIESDMRKDTKSMCSRLSVCGLQAISHKSDKVMLIFAVLIVNF